MAYTQGFQNYRQDENKPNAYHGLTRITSVPCCLDGSLFSCSTTVFTWDQFWRISYNETDQRINISNKYDECKTSNK